MTEPENLGECEPGTAVRLQGIVWQETEKGMNLFIVKIVGVDVVGKKSKKNVDEQSKNSRKTVGKIIILSKIIEKHLNKKSIKNYPIKRNLVKCQ